MLLTDSFREQLLESTTFWKRGHADKNQNVKIISLSVEKYVLPIKIVIQQRWYVTIREENMNAH